MTRDKILQSIIDSGVVAIIRMADTSALFEVVAALKEGGIKCIEFTFAIPNAVKVIGDHASKYGSEILVGAGTVMDANSARQAIEAGAKYIVSPIFWNGIIEVCHDHGAVVIPGAFTPTEICAAWRAGADMVKVFPANAGGPQYIEDVRRPLPELRLLPTSGITVGNAGDYIRAGASAVGIGAALVDPELINRRKFSTLTTMSKQLVENVKNAREK